MRPIRRHHLRIYKSITWQAHCDCGWRHSDRIRPLFDEMVRQHKTDHRKRQQVPV